MKCLHLKRHFFSLIFSKLYYPCNFHQSIESIISTYHIKLFTKLVKVVIIVMHLEISNHVSIMGGLK